MNDTFGVGPLRGLTPDVGPIHDTPPRARRPRPRTHRRTARRAPPRRHALRRHTRRPRPRQGHRPPRTPAQSARTRSQAMIQHGTRRGYQQHQARGHRGVQVCEPCRDAHRDYMREYMHRTYDPDKRRARYENAKERGYYAT